MVSGQIKLSQISQICQWTNILDLKNFWDDSSLLPDSEIKTIIVFPCQKVIWVTELSWRFLYNKLGLKRPKA